MCNGPRHSLADAFVLLFFWLQADRLVAVYGQYCVDHMQALDLLQKCITTTPALKTWLDVRLFAFVLELSQAKCRSLTPCDQSIRPKWRR